MKFGAQFRRIQSNGPLDFGVNGLYTFQDLSPFGFQAHTNNPALEFFLQALPLSYVGVDPSNSDSNRDYRQNVVSGFAQDFFRATSRLSVNVGLRYDFYSNPTEAHGRLSAIRNPATDSGPTVGKVFAATPRDLLSPQAGFAWNIFGDGKTVLRGGVGVFRDQLPFILFGVDRFLPPFFGINSYVFPSFLNPQERFANATHIRYSDNLPSEVPLRVAIQSQPGTGNRVGYDSHRRLFWCARQSPSSRSRSRTLSNQPWAIATIRTCLHLC